VKMVLDNGRGTVTISLEDGDFLGDYQYYRGPTIEETFPVTDLGGRLWADYQLVRFAWEHFAGRQGTHSFAGTVIQKEE